MISAYRIQTISDAACIKDLVIENTELKASIKKAVTPTEDSSEQGDIIDFNSPDPYIHTMPEALPDFHEQSRYSESFAELVVQKNLPKKTTSDKNDALKEMKIIDDWCDEAQSEHFTANLLYQETPIGSLTSDQIPIVTSTISGHKTLTDISKLPKLSCNGTQQENDIEISLFESAIARMKEIDGEFLSEHRIRSIILGLFKSNSKVYGWWFDNILPTIIKDQLKSADSIIDRIRKSFGDPSRSDNAFSALRILIPFDGSHESTDSYWKEFARLRRIALPNHDHDIQTQFPDYAAIKVFIKGCPPSISITFVQHVTSERKFIAIQYIQSRQTPNVPEEFILDAFLIWLKGKITLFKIDPVANIYNPLKAYTSPIFHVGAAAADSAHDIGVLYGRSRHQNTEPIVDRLASSIPNYESLVTRCNELKAMKWETMPKTERAEFSFLRNKLLPIKAWRLSNPPFFPCQRTACTKTIVLHWGRDCPNPTSPFVGRSCGRRSTNFDGYDRG